MIERHMDSPIPMPCGLGLREERIENAVDVRRINPRTGILNLQ